MWGDNILGICPAQSVHNIFIKVFGKCGKMLLVILHCITNFLPLYRCKHFPAGVQFKMTSHQSRLPLDMNARREYVETKMKNKLYLGICCHYINKHVWFYLNWESLSTLLSRLISFRDLACRVWTLSSSELWLHLVIFVTVIAGICPWSRVMALSVWLEAGAVFHFSI